MRCNSDGTAEVSESCTLGCNATQVRCNDIDPSNGLGQYLDVTSGEPDFDLGTAATINTDNGTVMVDGKPVAMRSALVAQTSAPTILVFIVHSLTAADVTITGDNAFAVVSSSDIKLGGVFAASAHGSMPGPGRYNDGTCRGGEADTAVGQALGGAGGGGFGAAGGRGGTATNDNGTSAGGAGGTSTGNANLVPLRGGCDGGELGTIAGTGGGAMQLVSRTKITVSGVVAANGSSFIGGGSGGGILLEAPIVEASGSVVANGGGGASGCLLPMPGEDGRLDAAPATGGLACGNNNGLAGVNGGAGNSGAGNGAGSSRTGEGAVVVVFAGHGGGGVGRIRVNTTPGGFHRAGLFSPNPSTGALATR
ncbi:MAG TPA: hypothetical protein VF469_30990 [Kofleriaceae bacterium]